MSAPGYYGDPNLPISYTYLGASYQNANPLTFDFSAASGAATSAPSYDAVYHAQATMYDQAWYYQDPNVQNLPNPCASGVSTNGSNQFVAAPVNRTSWKNIPKKQKMPVQHVWCEVCKIECNSKEILDSHRQGKKHKKKLENLKASLTSAPAHVAPAVPNDHIIGPSENPKKRKAKANEFEDLETKKKKIVECGTTVDGLRTCEPCNVVCNNEIVLKYHLVGKKHLLMMKKGRVGLS